MNKEYLQFIVSQFDVDFTEVIINEFGAGLINKTFLVIGQNKKSKERFILQQINKRIFKHPPLVMENIHRVANHLSAKDFYQKQLEIILSKNGQLYVEDLQNEFWRMFPFIENTFVLNEITAKKTAYEGAKAFGDFLKMLWDMDTNFMHISIPDFHNTPLRFQHFTNTVLEGPPERNNLAKAEIHFFKKQAHLLTSLPTNFPIRVTHNDTKINNILFDTDTKEGISVIDWDTLMPGWIIHDFGDMVRTFTNPVGEEEVKFSKVFMNIDFFKALSKGFMESLASFLSPIEKENLVHGALVITYEQGIRFLTDYLLGNIYYKVEYAEQNLVRAQNQIVLLKSMLKQRKEMEQIISRLSNINFI